MSVRCRELFSQLIRFRQLHRARRLLVNGCSRDRLGRTIFATNITIGARISTGLGDDDAGRNGTEKW